MTDKAKDKSAPDTGPVTPAGQEAVEDRPMVGSVTPEDYPEADRADADATGAKRP